MLTMLPIQPVPSAEEMMEGKPLSMEARSGAELLGSAGTQVRDGLLCVQVSLEEPDALLADGLIRATLNAANLQGIQRAAVLLPSGELGEALSAMGYRDGRSIDLETFFSGHCGGDCANCEGC